MKKDDKTERIWNGKKCLRVTPKEKSIYHWMNYYLDPDPEYNTSDCLAERIIEEEMFTEDDYNEVKAFIDRLIKIHFIKTEKV